MDQTTLNAVVEMLFPHEPAPLAARARAAWGAFWRRDQPGSIEAFDVHQHSIRTARGVIARTTDDV